MEDLSAPTFAPAMEATLAPTTGWTYEDYQEWLREAQQRRAGRIYVGMVCIFVVVGLRVLGGYVWGRYQHRRRRRVAEQAAEKARERRRTRIENKLRFITWHDGTTMKNLHPTCTNATTTDTSLSALESGTSRTKKESAEGGVSDTNSESITAMNTENSEDEENEPTCAICFTPFEDGQIICGSNNPDCPHMYCKECISSWLLQNEECPTCRRPYLTWPIKSSAGTCGDENEGEVPLRGGAGAGAGAGYNASDQTSNDNETSIENESSNESTNTNNTTRTEEYI